MWKKEPVDIILTDIEMPEMSGLELLKKIRSEEELVRFIILTGYDDFEYAISTGEKQWTVIAIVLHVAGYVPIYLRNIDIYKSSMTLFVIATVFTFAIALFAYQIYHRTENGKK